jgi:outer membrane murein-binding lipoprotein Lpp
MENNNMNVQDIVKIAVELEAKKAEVVGAKADAKLYKTLYEDQKQKNESPQKVEVRFTKESSTYNPFTGYNNGFSTVDVITTDLVDAVARVKKEIETAKTTEIEAKDETIKKLSKKLKENQEELNDKVNENAKEYEKWKKNKEEKHSTKVETLTKEIESLEEDLQKERENKSDAEVEKKRLQEIADLKVRIMNLESELSLLTGLTWFKRTWLWKSILSLQAKTKAYMEAAQNERAANNVINHYSGWRW